MPSLYMLVSPAVQVGLLIIPSAQPSGTTRWSLFSAVVAASRTGIAGLDTCAKPTDRLGVGLHGSRSRVPSFLHVVLHLGRKSFGSCDSIRRAASDHASKGLAGRSLNRGAGGVWVDK